MRPSTTCTSGRRATVIIWEGIALGPGDNFHADIMRCISARRNPDYKRQSSSSRRQVRHPK